MLECCPGSAYRLETIDYVSNNVVDAHFCKFHRVFWTFKPACDAFNYTKLIIQINGTFLCGKYRGALLIGTTQDDNAHVLPIAFVVVEVVANQNNDCKPPYGYHVYCIRHIASNFNHRCKNVKLKEDYTTCKHNFFRRLEQFHEISPEIHRWIDGISLEKFVDVLLEKKYSLFYMFNLI
uniref:MULE transposase domain-containing protein n=1 Tax=Cajanus cajan TaxID=3821 RepID=A0A151QQI4_CAJCA|nr:hypothetical protein KK1_046790 [Cajanus cajan]